MITTDHGRGSAQGDQWRDHRQKIPDADQIWLAIQGPDTSPDGEMKTAGQLYQNQVAKTAAAFLGLDFSNGGTSGAVISSAIRAKSDK